LPQFLGGQRGLWGILKKFKLAWFAASGIEPGKVSLQMGSFAQMLQGFFQDRGSHSILWNDQAVVHPSSLAPGGGNSRTPEVGKMP